MAEQNYLNIDGEISTTPVGYNSLLSKEGTETLDIDANTDATNEIDLSGGINNSNSTTILGSSAVNFNQTTLNTLQVNQNMKSSNFIAGSSGWQIQGDGDVEFGSGIFRGTITATAGSIGGWTIATNELYATTTGTIKTAATVGAGSNGVLLDKDGLKVYDAVLGVVVNLPSDGSAPSFSSGTINETIFEISTNSVLRTSATVGDGTVNSAGVLINNTGIYACQASQLLADANVKILTTGSATFTGTITSSTITGGTLQTASSGTRIIIAGANNNLKFYSGAEASPRVYIGTDSSTTSHIYISNPVSSSKDALVIYNQDGIALDIHNNNSAAGQAVIIDHDGVAPGIQYDGSANLNETSGQEAHLYFKKTGTGAGRLAYFRNEGTGTGIYIENNVGTVGSPAALSIEHYGTGSALQIVDGDVDLGNQRLTNLLIKDGAPSAAELGTYGLGYDYTNNRLYFNNNGSVKYAQFG